MDFTEQEMQRYHQVLKEHVCSLCCRSGYEEVCRIGKDKICPFDLHLKQIVEAVLSTPKSNSLSDYFPKLRELVCSKCERQDEHGVCDSRDLAYCSLDSLFALVVDAIESAGKVTV